MDFLEFASQSRLRVDATLTKFLDEFSEAESTLLQAIRYSLFSGGKRIRPILVYATARALRISNESVDAIAAAVELIHGYSLIHDDLPAMDDDDFRRGKPACHKIFGEAIAILAGDAMQSLAFQLLASSDYHPSSAIKMVHSLAKSIGIHGMASGQAFDLFHTNEQSTIVELDKMHALKTGALFSACVKLVCLLDANLSETRCGKLAQYAKHLGLAFQIRDDLQDVESDKMLAEQQQAKLTYPQKIGISESRARLTSVCDQAISVLETFDQADMLAAIIHFVRGEING